MKYEKNRILLLTPVVAFFLATAAIAGQPTPSKPLSDSEFVDLLESRKKQVDVLGDLDDTTKSKVKDLYGQALEEMKAAARWAAVTAQNQKLIDDTPEELHQTKTALAVQPSQPETIAADANLGQIEQTISDREAELEKLRKILADDEAVLKGGASHRAKVLEQINAVKERLVGINERLQTPPTSDEKPAVTTARQAFLESQKRSAEHEIQSCEKDLKTQEVRAELLPQRRDLDARQIAIKEQSLKQWQDLANRRRKREAEQQAERAEREANQAHPEIQQLMSVNKLLADDRKKLAASIAECSAQLDMINRNLADLKRDYRNARDKVDAVGLTNEIGQMLRKQRETLLPGYRECCHDISSRQQAIGQQQLKQLTYRDQRYAWSDIDAQTQAELEKIGPLPTTTNREKLSKAIREALATQHDYLDALISDHDIYYDKLKKLKDAEQELGEVTESYTRYINERVLWIASSDAFGIDDVRNLGEAAWWLAGPNSWIAVGHGILSDARQHITLWIVALGVFLLLSLRRQRIRSKIEEIGQQCARGSCCRFLPTMEAVVLTALLSVAGPGLTWFVGWRLSLCGELCKPMGYGLSETAKIFLAMELLRNTCRRGGLGASHFGWSISALKLVRQNLHWFMLPVLPLMYVAVAMAWCNIDPRSGWDAANLDAALGRIAFVAAMLCFALVLHRIFRPAGVICQTMIAQRPGGWLDRFRYVWYPLIALTPVALAILAAVGYHYTARQLVTRLVLSTYVLVGGIVCRALLLRWTMVNQRKLAIEQARQRRAANQCENVSGEDVNAQIPPATAPERDLAVINTQTRRLIEYSLVVACSLVLWCAWSDVLPALNMLNRYEVWNANSAIDKIAEVDNAAKPVSEPTTVATVPAVSTAATSTGVTGQFERHPGAVTLADLCLAMIFLATTVIAAKNIPGLLEIAVLQHMPLDAGARYAVATVCRYIITITGIALCCSFLGVGWSKIQWLVAAMSLGLGFGLQEIFANFISGLIILFERPIRVGDIVTIDQISGVVSRIRMRATTITDWDRKELIIPNKEFITGRVLNWTLSDPVNRVVVNVGIAYGSDTQKATEILLKLAQNHPHVLADPPPRVTLESFGDSALNFVLRCFLPNLENRVTVIHELHMGIDQSFRAAGIEIAFPQHDVHVRSIEVPPAMLQSAGLGELSKRLSDKAA
jgi:potassium efflux system protein